MTEVIEQAEPMRKMIVAQMKSTGWNVGVCEENRRVDNPLIFEFTQPNMGVSATVDITVYSSWDDRKSGKLTASVNEVTVRKGKLSYRFNIRGVSNSIKFSPTKGEKLLRNDANRLCNIVEEETAASVTKFIAYVKNREERNNAVKEAVDGVFLPDHIERLSDEAFKRMCENDRYFAKDGSINPIEHLCVSIPARGPSPQIDVTIKPDWRLNGSERQYGAEISVRCASPEVAAKTMRLLAAEYPVEDAETRVSIIR